MRTVAKLAELINEGSHIHVASRRRRRLKRIARHANRHFGLAVREFWPWDRIDCVHVRCSWHYRRAGMWWACLGCPRNGKRRNLALDASGARQREFFDWCLNRFGYPSGPFQR